MKQTTKNLHNNLLLTLKAKLSRPVLPIGNGHEQRREVDRRACGVWRITLASDWSQGEASRIDGQRNDGDRASNNRSAGKTWP